MSNKVKITVLASQIPVKSPLTPGPLVSYNAKQSSPPHLCCRTLTLLMNTVREEKKQKLNIKEKVGDAAKSNACNYYTKTTYCHFMHTHYDNPLLFFHSTWFSFFSPNLCMII